MIRESVHQIIKFIVLFIQFSIILACHVNSEVTQIKASEDEISYKIYPRNSVLYFGEIKNLSAGGGAGNYKFKIQSQSGNGASVTESGLFSVGNLDAENLVTILATDRINQQAFATMRILPSLKISASSNQIIVGKQMNFIANGGMGPYKFSASSGNMNQNTGVFLLNNGVSTVDISVTDVNNKIKTVSYNVAPPLVLSTNSNSLVSTETIALTSVQNVYASGGLPPYTFSIELGDGAGSLISSTSSSTFYPGSSVGFTKISVKDSAGQRSFVNIEVVELLRMNVNEVSITKSGEFIFEAIGGKAPYTFSLNESNPSFTADQGSLNSSSGLYNAPTNFDSVLRDTRRVLVTDSLGQTAQAIVHVINQLSLSLTANDLMVGTTAQVLASGGQPPISITAQSSCGSIIGTNSDYYKAPDIVPASPSTCTITATDSVGNITSKLVRIYPQIQLTLSKSRIASGATLSMIASGGVVNNSSQYTFSIVSGGGSIGSSSIYNLANYIAPMSLAGNQAVLKVQDGQGNSVHSTVGLYTELSIIPVSSVFLTRNSNQNFISSGGFGNITWSLVPGSVGAITSTSGGPSSPSTAIFLSDQLGSGVILASDQDGNVVQTTYQILDNFAANPNPIYIQKSPASGSSSSIQIDAVGGLRLSSEPYYTFSIASSNLNLPSVISGQFQSGTNIYIAPKSSGTETVRIQDNNGQEILIPVTIYDEMFVTPINSNLIKGESVELSVQGGVSPYSWSITSNSGVIGQGTLSSTSGENVSFDSTSHLGVGTNQVEITITDSKPGSPNTVKAYVNVSSIAKVTNVTANSGSATQSYFGIGQMIPVTVSFDRVVNVTGIPQLKLNSHGSTAFANYVSGNGTKVLTFNYQVLSGHSSLRLDYASTTSLQLNSGSITSGAIAADLTLPSPNTGANDSGTGGIGSLSINKYMTIDGQAPSIPNSILLNTAYSNPGTSSTPILDVGTNLENAATLELHTSLGCNNLVASVVVNSSTMQLTSSSLSEGVYDFYARQMDLAGNYSACSSSTVQYVLDQHQPSVSNLAVSDTDTGSSSFTNSTTVNLLISAVNAEQMYITNTAGCNVGGVYEAYSSTKSWTLSSGDGVKNVYYKVKSSLGTESSCGVSNAITLDTSEPTATISGAPSGTNNLTILNVSIGGIDVVKYQYKIGPAATTDCTQSNGYSADTLQSSNITNSIVALADGNIKLCVLGKDNSGNYQSLSSPTEATWNKLTALPLALLGGALPMGANQTTILNVRVSGSGLAYYKYKVGLLASTICSDSSGYSADIDIISSPDIQDSIAGLPDGEIRLCVVGKDQSGNYQAFADATSATWVKDLTPPAVPIIALHSSNSISPNQNSIPIFTISGLSNGDNVELVLDDATCSSGYLGGGVFSDPWIELDASQTPLNEGSYMFYALASDSAGNSSCSSTGVSYIVDLTAPTDPSGIILGGLTAPLSETPTITVGVVSTDAVGSVIYEAQIYDSGNAPVGSPIEFTNTQKITGLNLTGNSVYKLEVRAKDSAGNLSQVSEMSATWTAGDPCLDSPTPGTVCSGGSIFLGTLSPGATSGSGTDRYMTTPGGCGGIPANLISGGSDGLYTSYSNSDFTPTCSGTDSVQKTWSSDNTNYYDIPDLINYNSVGSYTDDKYGNENTTILVSITDYSKGGWYAAARYCDKLNYGGYTDWYLPNRAELNLMWINKASLPGLGNYSYWSSTEYNNYGPWFQSFVDGSVNYVLRNSANLVRCVRRF